MRHFLLAAFSSLVLALGVAGCGDDDGGGGGGSCSFCDKAESLCSADGGGGGVTDCNCGDVPGSVNSCAESASSCSEVISCASM